jgi:hypothetical protein
VIPRPLAGKDYAALSINPEANLGLKPEVIRRVDMLLIYFITDFCDIIIEKLERLNMEVRAKEWLNTILLFFYTASIFKRR